MFPIDVTLLPSLTTRRALLVVDAQNDFLAEDGALPARMPTDLPKRISDLAGDFRRSGGEIIWVQSRFESSRPMDEEQIMMSETSSPSSAPAPRGRRPRTTAPASETLVSPEAFLTLGPGNGLSCARVGTTGIEMHPVIKQTVGPRDHVLTKTFYSAFKIDELIRLLRMRLVTELFICGSSTNVGVMATAIDAASYGYTITIVDDCCGSQSMSGHRNALRQITNTTGCETLSAAKVLSMMRPKPPPKPATSSERGMNQQYQDRGTAGGGRSPTVRLRRGRNDAVAPSPVSDIQSSLERLSLSGQAAAADEYAPETLLAPSSSSSPPSPPSPQQRQRRQQPQSRSGSQSQSQSQSQQSQRALQSMARSGHPQTKNQQTDRDTLIPQTLSTATATAVTAATAAGHVSAAAARRSAAGDKMPDGGRHDSGERSDEQVVGAADLVTWGSISSSSSSPSSSKRRPQQKRTPPSSAASAAAATAPLELLRRSASANTDNSNVRITNDNVNSKAPTKSKGVEYLTTTSSNASTRSRSTASAESSPSENINMHNDDVASSSKPSSSKKADSKITSNSNSNSSSSSSKSSKSKSKSKSSSKMTPRQKESPPLCEGDTKVIYDILPDELALDMFTRLHAEVSWQRMSHQGGEVPRLVAVQGVVGPDGSKPVYRHPADSSPPLLPFTPAVNTIRRIVEEVLSHELNHVLIQLYRSGEDFISEHSDKTLDIKRDSCIANVSLGAERTMTLRTKRRPKNSGSGEDGGKDGSGDGLKRSVQRAVLPHNSLFKMGLDTNMRWLHGVRADKRTAREKSAAELVNEGARISLTFRRIATYLDAEETKIWGQGATAKTRDAAKNVVNGQTDQAVAMLRAFGRENQDTEFDWEANYGSGFDVLHIGDAKRLFLSGDSVVDLRITSVLAEYGVSYARGSLAGDTQGVKVKGEGKQSDPPVRFIDNDDDRTVVDGQRFIMLYLQKTYGGTRIENDGRAHERWSQGMVFLDLWRSVSSSPSSIPSIKEKGTARLEDLLAPWEEYASEDSFIAGPDISLADFAFWPVLEDIFSSSPLLRGDSEFSNLQAYHDHMCRREGIARLLRA